MRKKKTIGKSSLSLKESIFDGDVYFKSLLADLENAKETIDIESYIYANDYFGAKVADVITRAVAKNVKVRVMVDGIGTPFFHKALMQMELAGAQVRVYHPIPFNWSHYRRANIQSSLLFKFFASIAKLNSRNHRKTCIIDKKIVYAGSCNIDGRHLNKKLSGESWRDTVIKLNHVNVADLQFAFDLAWDGFSIDMQIKKRLRKIKLHPIFRLNYSRKLRRRWYKAILSKISKAKKRVWITSAYFNPDYFILRRLAKAAKRGVDVRIILPFQSDVLISKIVATTYYTQLLKSGVSIYEYLPSILHAKTFNADNWYSVGSSNLNQRSLRHDLEVDVCVSTRAGKLAMQKQYLSNIKNSRKIGLDDIKKQPKYKMFIGNILLIGKYFL